MERPNYHWQAIDWQQLTQDYPPPGLFETSVGQMSEGEIRALQNTRFLARMAEAWQYPFYRDRWQAAGLEPGDIRSLDDIEKIPTFNSDDLKAAFERAPPFGDHQPGDPAYFRDAHLRILTSGGTTGLPRVTLFDAQTLEIQGIQSARAFWAQGLRPSDILQITYTNSLANAAWCTLNGAFNWIGATPMTTGAGIVTSSERQLQYAKAWGTTAWFTRAEYLARLVEVARDSGFDLHGLKTRQIHSHIGPDAGGLRRKALEEAWNAPVYDNYGTHEIGAVAFECREKSGLHISEDMVHIQIVDLEREAPLPDGQVGNLIATSLYRSVPPIIRFNMRDQLALYPRERCGCGLCTRKLSGFHGRSDEMVKLRGTNVYPLACMEAVTRTPGTNGEYICIVSHEGEGLAQRERFVVQVERSAESVAPEPLRAELEAALHRDLGVKVDVEIVDPGATAPHTGLGLQNKTKRLLDLRR
ncbi:phenylacetate--CoA ligase family protein [Pararhodobacter oceanensis]|uniref:phenylacetate--CoA ligase family protein n=1 Tax=Pararhodobacter oceanensis TaxID=2172121 RepID=UPI003A8DE023